MTQRDGFFYYYSDYLGMDTGSYLIQYDAGFTQNYSGCNHPEFNRSLAFPQEIQNATGTNSYEWTHFFLYNKTGSGQGILFSSFEGSYPYSGYTIGVTDDNKIYFETYDNFGPVVRVGQHINSAHNAVGVTLVNNSVSFNYYDFGLQDTDTESFPVQSKFVLPYNRAFIGGNPILPSYSKGVNFPGTIDNYIYVSDAINADYFDALFSGFYSYYDLVPGPVTTGSYEDITGYQQIASGHTGVTGYQLTSGLAGTGANGQPYYTYGSSPLSGFILDGYIYEALTGLVYTYSTGQSTYSLVIDENFVNTFTYDHATILTGPQTGDINWFYGSPSTQDGNFNLRGDYDQGEGAFDLQDIYNDQDVQLFLNGNALSNAGYSITGNVYGSGYLISGDYFLDDFEVVTRLPIPTSYTGYAYYNSSGTGIGLVTYPVNNTLIYDYVPSGQKMSVPFTATSAGQTSALGLTANSLVFLDGKKLNYHVDYNVVNGKLQWITNSHANYLGTGILTAFTETTDTIAVSGQQFGSLPEFQKDSSRVFRNGQRLILNTDYVENSQLDFLKFVTIMETGFVPLYNGEDQYFE